MSRIIDGKVSLGRTSFQFRFNDFAALDSTKNHYILSPKFTYNGHQWQLGIYPGGDSEADEGDVSAYLFHRSKGNITTTFEIHIIDKFGNAKIDCRSEDTVFISEVDNWGWQNFIPRSDILDKSEKILDSDGTLTLAVSFADETTSEFVPNNPFHKLMKEMFNDEATADVQFEVGNCVNKKKGKQKESKSPVSFHAHRSILMKCAPMLADLLGDNDTATITDVKPELFHHMLHHIYGGEVPSEALNTHAKDIIHAADKYAIVNLKLAAEAAYVESTDITCDNAIDNHLYADGKNCALLKEKVMNFLADHPKEVAEKISFTDCPGHVMKDLFVALSRKDQNDSEVDELTTLGVSALRRKLDEMGLEVDGSREAMIECIKNYSTSS